jgi:flagellar basal-body rod modification protein FlgD
MTTIDTTQYKNTYQSQPKTFEEQSSLGKEAFLKLLVTQLQNQDPTQPLQDKEFIAQMTQFSTLEQMTNLNDMFTKFVETQSIGGLSNMIGKKVTWTDKVQGGVDETGQPKYKDVQKEGIVKAISLKDGKSQLVLQDNSKIDVNLVETVEDNAQNTTENQNQPVTGQQMDGNTQQSSGQTDGAEGTQPSGEQIDGTEDAGQPVEQANGNSETPSPDDRSNEGGGV